MRAAAGAGAVADAAGPRGLPAAHDALPVQRRHHEPRALTRLPACEPQLRGVLHHPVSSHRRQDSRRILCATLCTLYFTYPYEVHTQILYLHYFLLDSYFDWYTLEYCIQYEYCSTLYLARHCTVLIHIYYSISHVLYYCCFLGVAQVVHSKGHT